MAHQTHPEVCLANLLGGFQARQIDKHDKPLQASTHNACPASVWVTATLQPDFVFLSSSDDSHQAVVLHFSTFYNLYFTFP